MKSNNTVHKTAKIHENIVLGEHNIIGPGVVIDYIGGGEEIINIGDNNVFNENTRIIVNGSLSIGHWNVFHNNMLIMADDYISIGNNCWFGQNTILDGAGGLSIRNGVRVGMYSQIWTHVASGEQIEGCTLYGKRETIINDDVWLVGSCIVGSGLTLGKRSIILINSVLTKDTEPNSTYAGSPAKIMENLQFYKAISLEEKFDLLSNWIQEFASQSVDIDFETKGGEIILLKRPVTDEEVIFYKNQSNYLCNNDSSFFLDTKVFNMTNIKLERDIYKFLYNNKARFNPIVNE